MVPAVFTRWHLIRTEKLKSRNKGKRYATCFMEVSLMQFGYLRSASGEWTIGLIDYDRISHVVHDNVFECHIRGSTASWRVSPCLDPNSIGGACHGAVLHYESADISFVRIFS